MRPFALFIALIVTIFGVNAASTEKTNLTPIEHVVVLMMENRSLDHMLGFLKQKNPEIDGCLPNENHCSNPADPADANSQVYTVDDTAIYQQASPDHSISGTTFQIFGSSTGTEPVMNGFIKSYTDATGDSTAGPTIMKCFSPEHVPTLANLTLEYTLIDGYFSSVPGPTMPNRAFAASATSDGMGVNDVETIVRGMPQKTMFRQIEEMGLDYRVYFELAPTVLMFKDLRHKDARPRFHPLKKFYQDVEAGDLPQLTWLEPSYYNVGSRPATDQHPDHDVSLGDQLIKDVYDSIRNSTLWEKTALIITYDEHGGFFDHVIPPMNVPNPDGKNSTDDPFDYTRLGVRVPMVIVSPWVEKGKVVHAAPEGQGQYEHSSIISTVVHKLFKSAPLHPNPSYLNKRDEWAATFEHVFTSLSAPRQDCISEAPKPTPHREIFPNLPPMDGSDKITHLQLEVMAIVAGATEDDKWSVNAVENWTEAQAAEYCKTRLNAYFGTNIVSF